jgi:hypothetical protein
MLRHADSQIERGMCAIAEAKAATRGSGTTLRRPLSRALIAAPLHAPIPLSPSQVDSADRGALLDLLAAIKRCQRQTSNELACPCELSTHHACT